MPRYIDEKEVYKLVEPRGKATVHCTQIDDLPRADVVEIVRCKDCQKSFRRETGSRLNYYWCGKWNNIMRDCDFCSQGERREQTDGNNKGTDHTEND